MAPRLLVGSYLITLLFDFIKLYWNILDYIGIYWIILEKEPGTYLANFAAVMGQCARWVPFCSTSLLWANLVWHLLPWEETGLVYIQISTFFLLWDCISIMHSMSLLRLYIYYALNELIELCWKGELQFRTGHTLSSPVSSELLTDLAGQVPAAQGHRVITFALDRYNINSGQRNK